ncbi:Tyrosine kinase catalytic domain protein [Ceratobasidium sp. AG-Ba]|nr:Tyrosine kinase catalytic domain protein [Ceratobasidium sp. AG-Ba]
MPVFEVIKHLSRHNCRDITDQLDPTSGSLYPVSNGGFGDIFKAMLRDGTHVAVKTPRVYANSTTEGTKHLKDAARELYVWAKCNHPNVIKLLGLVEFRGRIGMVTIWMENGNLSYYLSQNPEVKRHYVVSRVCHAIVYLHGRDIVHGDLKAANILVSPDGSPMLTDFGNVMSNFQTLGFTTTADKSHLSLRWAAPELFEGRISCNKKTDIYALGMTILEIITGRQPYYEKASELAVMVAVLSQETPSRPDSSMFPGDSYGDRLWGLLLKCWSNQPKYRPDARKINFCVNVLPVELVERICESLFALTPSTRHGRDLTISRKPTWASVSGFMSASPTFHKMGFAHWVRVLTVYKHEDWEEIFECSPSVLELRCLDGAFTSETPRGIIVQFKCLRALYIDAHGDIIRHESGQLVHRDLFKALPSSLLRLEIAHAHKSDLSVVQTIRRDCPDLTVLRLGRCSMFNMIPPCAFWQEYPLDHDTYIAEIRIDVLGELTTMHNLKTLGVGIYCVKPGVILAHRAHHTRGMAAPDRVNWQQALSIVRGITVPQLPAGFGQNLLVNFYPQDTKPDFGPDSCAFCHESFELSRELESQIPSRPKRAGEELHRPFDSSLDDSLLFSGSNK